MQGAWGQTHPGGKQSGCTGCPGNRRQRSPSTAGWSVDSHSNLEDIETSQSIASELLDQSLLYDLMSFVLVLTVQKLGVNVPQDICHSQLLSRTGASMNPEPGWFGQSRTQSSDGQSSGQGRHQAPLRLLGQGGAPSPPATSRDSRTRRGIHDHPLSLLSVVPLLTVGDGTKRSVSKVSQLIVQSKKLAGTANVTWATNGWQRSWRFDHGSI